jgi:hypothetical protein
MTPQTMPPTEAEEPRLSPASRARAAAPKALAVAAAFAAAVARNVVTALLLHYLGLR